MPALLRLQHLKRALQSFFHNHHSPKIIELPHKIGHTEQRDQSLIEHKLIPHLNHLMRSDYQLEVILSEEVNH